MTEQANDLKEQAEELGIKVDGRWSDEKIQAAIDAELEKDEVPSLDLEPEVKPEPKKAVGEMTLVNNGVRNHYIAGKVVAPGDSSTLTESQVSDERLMAKINNSIRCGVLKEVK